MLTVEQYFNLRKPSPKGLVGVEIEVEGSNLPAPAELTTTWLYTRDGSLRGESLEYVLAKPLSPKDAANAVLSLQSAFKANNGTVNDSMRAGVHIHLNVRNLSIKQLFTVCACYYILEELITRSAGESREGNLFALRLLDAYEPIYRISNFLRRGNPQELSSDEIRYAALNLSAVSKHGSIEFRQMRTPTDFTKVIDWIELLTTLRGNALDTFTSPLEVVTQFSGGGERQFVVDLLGEKLANKYILCHEDFQKSARNGARFVQDFAFILADDSAWDRAFGTQPVSRSRSSYSSQPAPLGGWIIQTTEEPEEEEE